MRTILLVVLSSLSWSASLAAQRLAVYGPASGGFVEVQPPMNQLQAVPAAIPPVLGYASGPLLLPAAPPYGDCTFDNVLGHLWYSDGLTIAAMASPSVPPVAPLPPPIPIAPAVLAITGRVTGMAIDGVTGVLFLCGLAGPVVGVLPNPGMPIVVAPFAIPWGTGPVSGLDWDGASGSLYAVDLSGVTYQFFPGGGPIGVPVAPPFVLPGPAGGVAIDRTLRPNAAGARPLFVAYGSQIVDVNDPQPVVFSGGVLGALGLAFLNVPAANPPNATCQCTGSTYPGPLFTTGPMTVGNAAFALGHGSLPPGFPMLFVFEVAGMVNTAYPWINAVGCGLGLVPGSAGFVVLTAVADPFGNAVLPLPLVGASLPVGTALFLQGATLCGTDPVFGLVLTPTYTVYAASV